MKKNTDKLILEYISSTGNTIDFRNEESKQEFINWHKKRREIIDTYRRFLKHNDLNICESSCIEVGTNLLNSVALPYNTTILTEYPDLFSELFYKRLLLGRLDIKDNKIFISADTEKGVVKEEIKDYDTFFAPNVLDSKLLDNWETIHNEKLGNIVLGAFGMPDDKDRIYKLSLLYHLKEKLTDLNYLESYYTDEDMYLYTIGSSRLGI